MRNILLRKPFFFNPTYRVILLSLYLSAFFSIVTVVIPLFISETNLFQQRKSNFHAIKNQPAGCLDNPPANQQESKVEFSRKLSREILHEKTEIQ